MDKKFISYCSRCGKERIISRKWKEKVGLSIVENTERSCPDKKCQKIINNEVSKMKKKRIEAEEKRKNMVRNKKKI
ncbi:hypothetical protein HY041_01380 [Candidatus Roizmanbacteria bacterium]|nr:hypothetical protein [Candidatus Roizmanbacteria bacterium]